MQHLGDPTAPDASAPFSASFNSAVQLCVESQQTLGASVTRLAEARAHGAPTARRRQIARDASAHLVAMSLLFDALRREAEAVAERLLVHGVDRETALVLVRARVRSYLYSRAFGEHEAEPVVARVEGWVRDRCRAA